MQLRITSKRQVTIPAHVLEAMGVGPQTTSSNSHQVPATTCYVRGASTARASERCERRLLTASYRSTSAHSATIPITRLCDSNIRNPPTRVNYKRPIAVKSPYSLYFQATGTMMP